MQEVMTINEASQFLKVSSGTLYNWVSQRRVPFVKIGGRTCFVRADLECWIAEHSVKPVAAPVGA